MESNKLKSKRVAAGLNQKDVAQKLNTTAKTLSIKENSKKCRFSVEDIQVMAKLYGLNLSDVNEIFFDSSLLKETNNEKQT